MEQTSNELVNLLHEFHYKLYKFGFAGSSAVSNISVYAVKGYLYAGKTNEAKKLARETLKGLLGEADKAYLCLFLGICPKLDGGDEVEILHLKRVKVFLVEKAVILIELFEEILVKAGVNKQLLES